MIYGAIMSGNYTSDTSLHTCAADAVAATKMLYTLILILVCFVSLNSSKTNLKFSILSKQAENITSCKIKR